MNALTGVRRKMVTEVIDLFHKEKISVGVLTAVILGAWYAYGWAGETYVEKDEFNQLTSLIVTHVEDMKIVNASQLIRDKELALQLAVATNESETQINHLKTEIADSKKYRECLIRKDPNCKHLKPAE